MKKYGLVFCIITCVLVWVFMLSAWTWTYTYDTDTPLGSDSPAVIDDRIRETKDAIQERQNIDHYWPLTGTEVSDADAGKHRQITFQAPIATTPTVAESQGDLRIKDFSGKAEFTWTDEDENELQITSVGKIVGNLTDDSVGAGEIQIANNTYLVAANAAGTAEVNLIKAGTNDLATLPDSAEMASNAAPVEDEAIANKKYVDDQDTADHPTYSGGESHTDGSGLIIKMGYVAYSSTTQTVTFGTPFPGGIVSVSVTNAHNSTASINLAIHSVGTSSFVIQAESSITGFYWQAWGY